MTNPLIQILAQMPAPRTIPVGGICCSECEHEVEIIDPYEIGETWRTAHECCAERCPYGKLEIDQE